MQIKLHEQPDQSLVRAVYGQLLLDKRIDALAGTLTPSQLKMVTDPCRRKAALCMRRVGKTWAMCVYMLMEALASRGSTVVYIGLSRGSAREAAWQKLLTFNADLQLGGQPNKSALRLDFPINGSSIMLLGADTSDQIKERLRGSHYALCVIDECGSWKQDLKEVTDDVIGPMLWDSDGTICMISTPGHRKGFFQDVTTGKVPGWSFHRWSIDENPNETLKRRQARDVDKMLADHGPTWPAYRREYLGEWVADAALRCYPGFNPGLNSVEALPPLAHGDNWIRVVSLDPGHNCALVSSAYSRGQPRLYIVATWFRQGVGTDDITRQIRAWERSQGAQFNRYVIDCADKISATQMRLHQGINWEQSDKNSQTKDISIDLLNSDLHARNVLLLAGQCDDLVSSLSDLCWDPDELKETGRRVEDKSSAPNHVTDALLYGWFNAYHMTGKQDRLPDPPRSDDPVGGDDPYLKAALLKSARDRAKANGPAQRTQDRQWQLRLQQLHRTRDDRHT